MIKAAGAVMHAGIRLLLNVRWERFLSVRFLAATLVAVIVVQLVAERADTPIAAPMANAGGERKEYYSFPKALRDRYVEFIRIEQGTHGIDFDDAVFSRNLKLLDERVWPDMVHPAALGLDNATGVAVDEARLRLLRLFDLGARELHPTHAAAAQVALECWAARAAQRRDNSALALCRNQYFAAVVALEDWLLPLRTLDPFHRRLAREYLAYANYKANVEGDQIDARHFADKGLRAAEANGPLEPEELHRWFGPERTEARDIAFWRIRLEAVLAKHRTGLRAVTAAIALARFDCWVERAAERATPAHVAKCRGDFIDVMREIEDRSAPAADRIAVRFAYDHLALAPAEREKIAHAARTALERNAIVSVAALTMAQGHETIEARMAWRRAEAVAGQLTALGVPAERIRLLSRAAHSNEREARTRRVDIVLD